MEWYAPNAGVQNAQNNGKYFFEQNELDLLSRLRDTHDFSLKKFEKNPFQWSDQAERSFERQPSRKRVITSLPRLSSAKHVQSLWQFT